jgi:PKD repeat protein
MKHGILALALAATTACAADSAFSPSPKPLSLTDPFALELSAAPGVGAGGGRASVTARVLNPQFSPLAATIVHFTAASGSLTQSEVATNADGYANTTLSANAGSITVTATAGSLSQTTQVAMQAVVLPPATPPPAEPEPVPSPPLLIGMSFTVPIANEPVYFNVVGTVPLPMTASWDFGDGGAFTSGAMTATHTFAAAGFFPVTLTIVDGIGRTATKNSQVQVLAAAPPPPPPVPVITVSCTTGVAHGSVSTCTLAGTLGGVAIAASDLSSVRFNWGDGTADSNAVGVSATHTYATAGTFTVTGTATVAGHTGTWSGTKATTIS